ncbi:methyltransferase domain-containing protein [Actinokineospora iranica]|uniref:Methyltransferase domain-containing protein n=1 Tax=Actinokineospora iranica TaxID=1271860 RepID=A0A1G6STK1_9PSEU|nr:methyltransferase domain-containing protein [Actinokineospora iranica]SDD19537.1 Methyltransferase domain-containing protein [Actinokineospora iranica]
MSSGVPSFRSDRIDTTPIDPLVEVLDLQAGLPGIVRLRAWGRQALAAQPGERVLDVGSGTGTETQTLAAAVGPDGDAVGVEPNPAMREVAERRAAQAASSARFVHGEATDLPFPDDTFDAVRSERVFQHLAEPDRAAAEIARVVRPGGRVVLIDTDWATAIMHPGEPAVIRAITETMLANVANPYAGRRLAGWLTAAGLRVTDIGSQALLQGPEVIEGPMVAMLTDRALAAGAITAGQRERLIADLAEGARVGDFHMSVTMFAVLAHR